MLTSKEKTPIVTEGPSLGSEASSVCAHLNTLRRKHQRQADLNLNLSPQ